MSVENRTVAGGFSEWEQQPQKYTSKSLFYRLTPGKHPVRFVGRPVAYQRPAFKAGEVTRERYLAHIIAQGQVRVLDMSKSIFSALTNYADGSNDRVSGPSAPRFLLIANGEGLKRTCNVYPDAPEPIPAGLNIAQMDQALLELGIKLERKHG